MKYFLNLQARYVVPTAPSWMKIALVPVLLLLEIEGVVSQKLRPVSSRFVHCVSYFRAMYEKLFPNTLQGAFGEVLLLLTLASAFGVLALGQAGWSAQEKLASSYGALGEKSSGAFSF